MNECKALSVKQPWASLIASGQKTIELRTWKINYRGPVLICSGGRPRKSRDGIIAPESDIERAFEGPLGQTLCLVTLADVRPATARDARAACSEPGERDFAWVLEEPRLVEHVPLKGRLSLFTVDLDELFRVRP